MLRNNPATGRPVETIGELLPLLPRSFRANFTLVYDSRSPFASSISPKYPRVVLFSDDARFVLAFTGDPNAPADDLVETMSFDDSAASFSLRAYLLPAAERRAWRPSAGASNCSSCHGGDARPIFDAYPIWPGFYGSVLDTFPRDRVGRSEKKLYQAFLAGPRRSGVYRALIFRRGSPVTPYLDPRRVRRGVVELDPAAFPFLPNARLGMALTELNRQRIYRKLAAAPGFAAHERDLLAELLECPSAPKPSRDALAAVRTALTAENAARIKRLGARANDPDRDVYEMEELKFVHALAEINDVAARAGVDRTDWSMALEPNSMAYFDGILSGIYRGRSYYLKEDLIFELLEHLAQRDPAFRRYFSYDAVFSDLGYPFGHRIDMGPALRSCPLLTGPVRTDQAQTGRPALHGG
ncbi:MAG: hypothetical protein ACHP7N_00385 [Caulobacterales bacterium]